MIDTDIKEVVLKPWVLTLTWRQQSTLFSALRGPDDRKSPHYLHWRDVIRWIRAVVQKDACEAEGLPECTYMGYESALPVLPSGRMSEHFHDHVDSALKVIGTHHPDRTVKDRALLLRQVGL